MMAISPDRMLHVDHFLKSLNKFGGIDYEFDLAVTDYSRLPTELSPELSKGTIHSFSEHHHTDHPPVRWLLEPKTDLCVFVDFDILIIDSLADLLRLCVGNKLYAAIVLKNHLTDEEFKSVFSVCGVPLPDFSFTTQLGQPVPFYPNFGFVVMSKDVFYALRDVYPINLKLIMSLAEEEDSFALTRFASQLALSVSVYQTGVDFESLSYKYNHSDMPHFFDDFDSSINEACVYHYMATKNLFFDLALMKKAQFAPKVDRVIRTIYPELKPKKFFG